MVLPLPSKRSFSRFLLFSSFLIFLFLTTFPTGLHYFQPQPNVVCEFDICHSFFLLPHDPKPGYFSLLFTFFVLPLIFFLPLDDPCSSIYNHVPLFVWCCLRSFYCCLCWPGFFVQCFSFSSFSHLKTTSSQSIT